MRLAGLVFGILMIILLAGCTTDSPKVRNPYASLQAENPDERILAIKRVGDRRDRRALPLLVDRLSDTESEVRFFAGIAMQKIVGKETFEQLGWRFDAPADENLKAIQAWRKWLIKNPAKAGKASKPDKVVQDVTPAADSPPASKEPAS